jgi:hypothetical protein
MNRRTSRRMFIQAAAAGSGCLLTPGLHSSPRFFQTAAGSVTAASRPDRANSPLAVVTQTVSTDLNPRARSWIYIAEILRRAGVFFDQFSPDQLPGLMRSRTPIVLLAGDLRLTGEQRKLLETAVRNGATLIGIGGTSGLDETFGVSGPAPLADAWMKVTAPEHAITAGLRSSLHVFGGYTVKRTTGTELAGVVSFNQDAKGSAIVENRCGKGTAVLIAPDLIFSVVHIQQGVPVLQDAKPAPDGSAAVNEGTLKAEDGFVLDWQRDRSPMMPDGVPEFIEPVSDELREIILRSIFWAAQEQDVPLPVLWYWPRGLKAVGHFSHDSDINEPDKAVALLEVMNRARVKSTWCTLYPGGYPRDFYRKLQDQGYEVALHYDAMTGGERTSWSRDNFVFQHRWLQKEAGLQHIATNKNHYTRWENRLDFFRWCEDLGINSDQTRGPSKKGTIGFPLGGSQPYFPLDDERNAPRFLPVLEVNMMTQDLVVTCPPEYGGQLLESAMRHNGVAHFLFHPAHILKPSVADTLSGLVDLGRAKGIEWWRSVEIYEWESLRRGARMLFDSAGSFSLQPARPLREATVLVLKSKARTRSLNVNGQPAPQKSWNWLGFEFDAIRLDAASEVRFQAT